MQAAADNCASGSGLGSDTGRAGPWHRPLPQLSHNTPHVECVTEIIRRTETPTKLSVSACHFWAN